MATPSAPEVTVERLIDLVWAGIEENPPWQSLVRELRRTFSCSYVGLVLRHPSRPVWDGFATSDADWDPQAWMDTYLPDYLNRHNAFADKHLIPGEVYTLDQVVDLEQWVRTEVFRECLRPSGIVHSLCIRLGEAGGYSGHLYCSRGEAHGPYSAQELALCRALAPWLQRGLKLFSTLMGKTIERELAEDALRTMRIGSVQMAVDGRILRLDRLAREILGRSPAIAIRDGRLHIHSSKAAETFRACCERVLEEGAADCALRLPRPGRLDLQCMVRLFERDYGQADERSLLIHLSDPELALADPTAGVIAGLFGLTRSEAVVATLLARGLSPAEAAEQLGFTLPTVRTYLKHIYHKTGVKRQAELVRSILTSLAILSTDGGKERPGRH